MTAEEINVVPEVPTHLNNIICLCRPYSTDDGDKIYLDSPYKAKDDIKGLSWERTHRRWDAEESMWELDHSAIARSIEKFTNDGYTVVVTNAVADSIN